MLLGEGGTLGLCRPEIWPAALRSNLADHLDPKEFNPEVLEAGLRELLSPRHNAQELSRWGRAQVEKNFDLRVIAAQVDGVYQRAARP